MTIISSIEQSFFLQFSAKPETVAQSRLKSSFQETRFLSPTKRRESRQPNCQTKGCALKKFASTQTKTPYTYTEKASKARALDWGHF